MDDLDLFYAAQAHGPHQPSPHTDVGDERRQAIVVAAYHLIVEKGFADFRIRDAAQRAGITAATLYYYFPTKEALIQAVDTYLTQLIVEHQERWAAQAFSTPREHLHAHLAGIQDLLRQDPAIFVALGELSVRSLRDPAIQRILDAGERSWQGYLASLLTAGMKQGLFRADLDPASAAWVIVSFLKGINLRSPPEELAAGMALLERWLSS